MKHAFKVGDEFVQIEFDGPYDASLWTIRRENYLYTTDREAYIGNGIDMRSSFESAFRTFKRNASQFTESMYTAVEKEVQDWLLTHPMTDIRQGDSICRLYCIISASI